MPFSMRWSKNDNEPDGDQGLTFQLPPVFEGGRRLISVGGSGMRYIASVGIGHPPTQVNLLVDTGSGNTWLRETKYVVTTSSKKTGNAVTLTFAGGADKFTGQEYIDTISIDSTLVIPEQSIGVGTITKGLEDDIDGILGLGPAILTQKTTKNKEIIPTVTDNLADLKIIPLNLFAIHHGPNLGGEVDFGVVHAKKFTDLTYRTITLTEPWKSFWGVDGLSFTYGNDDDTSKRTRLILGGIGFMDTGTTHFGMESDAVEIYCTTTGAVMNEKDGTVTISKAKFSKLQSVFVKINNLEFELTAKDQSWNLDNEDPVKLIFQRLPKNVPLNFILGFGFLRRFYTVYDRTNKQIGFANPKVTNTTN